ncbi:peptidylprolyl isomerase [Geobacter sp. FeAm09]|uniref:peptidylprolyl isomerase n=1 Tax=Geobacter sp. FeAm09 TaxID=2597769 RepID=UPI0011EE8405|nr:peptidylprolyl isomerase [Geobacter sp. FeAm09]QEM70115.1 peptidylprolyl isomerase [Geobacter sp. FeAm09]
MRRYTCALLLISLFLAPAGAHAKVINAIAAIVNDDIITLYEINREAQPALREADQKSPLDDAGRSKIRHTVLDQLIEKKLVEQKAKELNIKIGDDEIRQAIEDVKRQNKIPSQEALLGALASQGITYDQYRAQLQEQLERLRLVSIEVRSKIQVGESEMRDYYEANLAKYTEEESFHARHIFFRISDKAPAEEIKRAMTTALMVLAEAKSGKDFAGLAKSYSEDPAARKDGGDLGVFKKGDMLPELEQTIMALKSGEVSELVSTPAGFHIIKLEERIKGKVKPFESVKNEIEDTIYRKKSEDRFSQWAKELRSKASVEIKDLQGLL